ncbi:DNA repair protein RecO [uncultured Rhodoblastus sp.]|uniref:DNA repair protein RecO n=1 Tax=uncultured Rhodoblastus sp. TaxID=543037 RepID=UPI002600D2F3|nr:DNA repair protein RecO [uncultured Rhodoblastus sp.]
MEWSDRGLILGLKKHGESSVILELMTHGHGRHLGVVRGGRSKTMQPVLQPGNEVEAVWRARLEEHLGLYAVEGAVLRTDALISSAQGLHGVNWLGALLRLLPERDPHPGLYERAQVLLSHLGGPQAAGLFVHFELALLAALGFGLDLDSCAATGTQDDLVYVSPKSGRAVSRAAGAPWDAKLLPLPAFVRQAPGSAAAGDEICEGLRLTEFFLVRDVFAPRGLTAPASRAAFIARL